MTTPKLSEVKKANDLVKKGATIQSACDKVGISHATYYRQVHRLQKTSTKTKQIEEQKKAADPVKKIVSPPIETNEAQRLRRSGKSYQEIAQFLRKSMGDVYKDITGNDIVEAVEAAAEKKGCTRKIAANTILKVPFSMYTSQKYKEAQKTYGKHKKNKNPKNPKSLSLIVPTMDQVYEEQRALKKPSKGNKVVIIKCDMNDLSNVLKELE